MNIQTVSLDLIDIHPLNPRKTRPEADVARLAKRIEIVGFEVTRAPWCTEMLGRYEVFAGGTRLAAARAAGLKEIPLVVFPLMDDDEVVRLADQDNENDSQHVKVPLLDTWASYAALSDLGWTQERIAKAKGCDRTSVALRLALHEHLPKSGKKAVLDGLLDEGHCVAVLGLMLDVQQLNPWLTTSQAREELVREVTVSAPDTKRRGAVCTVEQVRAAAAGWKAVISRVETEYKALPEALRGEFVEALASSKVRKLHAVDVALSSVKASQVRLEKAAKEALHVKASEAEKREIEAQAAQDRADRVTALVAKVVHGDARKIAVPPGIELLLTDPPYGMALGKGRGVRKRADIQGDGDLDESVALLRDVLGRFVEEMKTDSTALIFCDWRCESAFADVVGEFLSIRGSLVWVKSNHGITDLERRFAPQHERIIHAVKGDPKLFGVRMSDVFHGASMQKAFHPTEKPMELLKSLVLSCSSPGGLVADPFCGSGSSLEAGLREGRDVWGCETDLKYVDHARNRLIF